MVISDFAVRQTGSEFEFSARVLSNMARCADFQLWFRFPQEIASFPVSGDPFLAGLLIPCMFIGEDLYIEAPVSRKMLEYVPRIQRLMRDWYPDLHSIKVNCSVKRESENNENNTQTGSFFSGGVDSIYTLLKHRTEIDRLILVHGFENPLRESELAAATETLVFSVARIFGKRVIQVQTNLREAVIINIIGPKKQFYQGSFFGFCYQGSILAAVGLCLDNRFNRMFIPASYTYDTLVPYGSHPLLDHLWSNENMDFIHDGCEASRWQKIKRIVSEVPEAVWKLQVCENNRPGQYNCCQCEKCLRTMIALQLCGELDHISTFHLPLNLQRVKYVANINRWQNDYSELLAEAHRLKELKIFDALSIVMGERFSVVRLFGQTMRAAGALTARLAPGLFYLIRGKRLKPWGNI